MRKILLIEDEALIRENIVELLEPEGFEMLLAENGHQGIQLVQQEIPDLILCDVMMPEIDGYDVLNFVRQFRKTAIVPFIFLTAKVAKADFRQGMELGADDYLTKPFTRSELLAAIRTQIKKKVAIEQQYQQHLNSVIYCDRLTQLPNRLSLREKFTDLKSKLTQSNDTNSLIPVMCLSLDRFNQISETLDDDYGDLLLKATAERLQTCLNSKDILAYLSENKFAIILGNESQNNLCDQEAIAQFILDTISKPFLINQKEIFVTASLGIAHYPINATDLEKLLKKANVAMDYAHSQGGNQYQFYQQDFKIQASDRLILETSLRYVLERDELQVYYQPSVSLKTGEVVGAEALLRWHSPERGAISPAKFIPIAEETGLIVSLGEWVCRQACQQISSWNRQFIQPLKVAVNLSTRQLIQPNLSQILVNILQETALLPNHLKLELTESILVKDPVLAKEKLNDLKELGIQIAIDDFGTGYSSLSYLQKFPFDFLKIDRCFVSQLADNAQNAAITIAIIQMAHTLNFKIIAEGVETEAELTFLRQHPCDEIQGYLFSPPLPAKDFTKLLESGKHLPPSKHSS
ncbi:MAG: EAL domain-containing protein [Halothece sp.]